VLSLIIIKEGMDRIYRIIRIRETIF
jgi:hypothetical protein